MYSLAFLFMKPHVLIDQLKNGFRIFQLQELHQVYQSDFSVFGTQVVG